MKNDKEMVKQFWNDASCGENLLLKSSDQAGYQTQADERYRLEPYILNFANFDNSKGKRVLETGVGLGADHQRFADAGAHLSEFIK